jgi:hypothetical protein
MATNTRRRAQERPPSLPSPAEERWYWRNRTGKYLGEHTSSQNTVVKKPELTLHGKRNQTFVEETGSGG